MHLCVPAGDYTVYMHLGTCAGQKSIRLPGPGALGGYEQSHEFCEPNPGPLPDQQELWRAKSSL